MNFYKCTRVFLLISCILLTYLMRISTIDKDSVKPEPAIPWTHQLIQAQRMSISSLRNRCSEEVEVKMKLPEVVDLHQALLDSLEPGLFMLETSNKNSLNIRQSCAVESGSRRSGRQPYVLFTSTHLDVCQEQILRLSELEKPPLFLHVQDTEFVKGSPIERIWTDGTIRTSCCKTIHLSDLLRILVVYKYGGWYSDLDTITLVNTSHIQHNLAADSGNGGFIGNANFGQRAGSLYLKSLLQAAAEKFTKESGWNALGPVMWTDVLKDLDLPLKLPDSQVGYHKGPDVWVADSIQYFPITGADRRMLFEKQPDDYWEKLFKDSVIVHFFNVLTGLRNCCDSGPGMAYDYLGLRHCPSTFSIHNHLNIFAPQIFNKTKLSKSDLNSKTTKLSDNSNSTN